MSTSSTKFQWDDPFMLDLQLTEDERQVKDAAAARPYRCICSANPVW